MICVILQMKFVEIYSGGICCAGRFNGYSLIMNKNWERPDATFSTDSCMSGGGGWCKQEYFHLEYPEWLVNGNQDINVLECLMILVALKIWARNWGRMNILCLCDNSSSVLAINSGASKNRIMQNILRNIHWLSAEYSVTIKAVLIGTKSNRLSDNLSRWHLSNKFKWNFHRLTEGKNMQEIVVPQSFLHLSDL